MVKDFEQESFFRECLEKDGINLFLGAGFSLLAQNKEGDTLCTGNGMKQELVKSFSLESLKERPLPDICQFLKNRQEAEFYRYLQRRFAVKSYDSRYAMVFRNRIHNIITLNVDSLLELLFSRENLDKTLEDVSITGSPESSEVAYFKLHGSITYPHDKKIFFTSDELFDNLIQSRDYFNLVKTKVDSYPTLFWGVDPTSEVVKRFLSKVNPVGDFKKRQKWFVLLPSGEFDYDAEKLRSNGINIIRGDTSGLLDYFSAAFRARDNSVSTTVSAHPTTPPRSSTLLERFKKDHIPSIRNGNHPVRSIRLFYEGNEPIWSDILNKEIIKLSKFTEILQLIKKKKSVLITGCPGSGKTTLLKQLAIADDSDNSYYFSLLTAERARQFVANLVPGTEYLVFLDNVADNLDAYKVLCGAKSRIVFVLAERDHNYERVKYEANFENVSVMDISDIPEADIRAICDRMKKKPWSKAGEKISLFELTYGTYTGNKADRRIKTMFEELEKQHDTELIKLYILLMYIRLTNTFVNMDTILAFFDYQLGYSLVQSKLDVIKSLVEEENDPYDYYEQDLFSLRSRLFAEVSIKLLPQETVGEVLLQFVENVPPYAMYRYDIFRRYGYDADITAKCFDDVAKGKLFYDTQLAREDSIFVRQQYALYLHRKGCLEDAWIQSDRAYSESNGKVYSVNNTHAMILFAMNIDKEEDEKHTVENTLHQTFQVLENCLAKDMRKPYHLLTYAKHAVKYYGRFGYNSQKAVEYICKARQYLIKYGDIKEILYGKARHQMQEVRKDVVDIWEDLDYKGLLQ